MALLNKGFSPHNTRKLQLRFWVPNWSFSSAGALAFSVDSRIADRRLPDIGRCGGVNTEELSNTFFALGPLFRPYSVCYTPPILISGKSQIRTRILSLGCAPFVRGSGGEFRDCLQ